MNGTVNKSIEYALGIAGPSIRVAPDLRRQAGFDPALVIDIHIPAASQEVVFAGPARIERADRAMDVHPEKAKVIALTSDRSTNEIKLDTLRFESRSSDAATVYKLFFRINPSEACTLHLPEVLWGKERLTLSKISIEASERTQPVSLRKLNE